MPSADHTKLRKFGLVIGGVFLLLGGWSYWRGHALPSLLMGGGGALLAILGALAPGLLAPVERAWMALAHVLARINTTLILTIFYFLIFAPFGFLRRCISDPLNRRMGQRKDSHWVRRAGPATDPARYRQQF